MIRKIMLIAALFLAFQTHACVAQDSGAGKKLSDYVVGIEKHSERALELYRKGEMKDAKAEWESAYFENFEYLEGPIRRTISAKRNSELEFKFAQIRKMIKRGDPFPVIEDSIKELLAELKVTLHELDRNKEKSQAPAALFFYSFFIILREGFEAILIICAIIAYLIKTGHKDKVKIIYHGCIIAIALSIITGILVKWVFRINAANQEIMEGITMLIAVVVLFFVSFWLISKVEAHKWMSYIKGKVDRSLTTGSMYALWFAAFLAVYREGAETVLFYSALVPGQGAAGVGVIFGGFIIGCIALTAVFIGVRFGSMRLPLKPFFIATSALLYYMAFVFAGKGIMELIEGGLIDPSLIISGPSAPFLGIYPYWQTIIPQGLLIIAALVGLRVTFSKKGGNHG
ncbi:MAG: FTR1 family protein [Candidatus Omnitrophota bacterium]|nr:FTR1 family protein [Candidatus Omnitrophota bacterium]